jgi:hypothetical protein
MVIRLADGKKEGELIAVDVQVGERAMKNLSSWPILAGAAADCRDSLRGLLPMLDRAIAGGGVSTELLLEMRALAAKHAESLKAALKKPEGSRRKRRKDDAWKSGGPVERSEGQAVTP